MLSSGVRILFTAVFISTLMALLTICLQVYSHFESTGVGSGSSFLLLLRANFAAAAYFLTLSGYLVTFLASYFFFTKATSRLVRVIVSTLLFVVSFLFFMLITGDSFSILEGTLLLAGTASVAISDAIANAVARVAKGQLAG